MRARTVAPVFAVAVTALFVLAPVGDAGAGTRNSGKPTTLVLYAENRNLLQIDRNQPGADNTDLVHRVQALSKTRGGPAIGDSYSQSEIVAIDTGKAIDVRHVEIEVSLPDGWLFVRGMSTLPIGTIPQPGWTAEYSIVGGTGKYDGARGSEQLTLLEDGRTFRVKLTFRR